MAQNIEEIKISQEESTSLESAYYNFQALSDLIIKGNVDDLILTRYEKSFAKYNKLLASITNKYIKPEYLTQEYGWAVDFDNSVINITKN